MRPVHPIEVASWDVDGTLYSLPRLRLAVTRAALRALGDQRSLRALHEMRELARWRERMDEVRRRGGDLAALYAGPDGAATRRDRERARVLETRWYGDALAEIGIRPEVVGLYDALRARGIRQVALSDYDSGYKLAALKLTDRFSAVFSGESIGWLKPSAQLYRQVAHELGVAPSRWLHIGDRVDRDQRPAREIGCQTLILGREWPSGLGLI